MTQWDYVDIARSLDAIAKAIEKLAESNIQAAKIQASGNPDHGKSALRAY